MQHHFFPNLVKEWTDIKDPRDPNYTNYDIEKILYLMMLKNIFDLPSMQDQGERVQIICITLKKSDQEFLPHYVIINDCLNKMNSEELEKVRNKLIRSLIRKQSFENAQFLGKY